MGISLHRGPVGEPGWSSFAGTFERQEVYLGSFLGPEGIKILSLGDIWNEQGSPELISDYGAKRARRP